MKQKIYQTVYGKDENGYVDIPKHLSFSKKWILETFGWHIYWITCYCPSCYGPRRLRSRNRSWKKYRKHQYRKVV